jgi:glycosyltransferase involved in cell wall biosynthesis
MPYPLADGGAVGIYNITKSLAALGHEITLVTYPLDTSTETDEAVNDISRFAKVRLVSKPLPPRWRVLLRTVFRGAYPIERRMMPEMFDLLDQIVKSEQFDIVHVDHAHMGRYGLWLKARFGLPIVLREHNFESQIYERFARTEKNLLKRLVARIHGKRLKREEIRFLNEFDAVAAISDEDLKLMKEVAPTSQFAVIPAGVDTEHFRPSDGPVEENSILSIGTFAWDPNFDAMRYFLQSIFPKILRMRPETILTMVGAEEERIRPFAAPFGNSVRLLGQVPDVRDYLARSAVLVVPLRIGGGMRVKLLEFFASGKAVVSTSVGAEGNLARHGAEISIADTPEAFASAVLQLLADMELRQSLGRSARCLVEERYAWSGIARAFEHFYGSVLADRNNVPTQPR